MATLFPSRPELEFPGWPRGSVQGGGRTRAAFRGTCEGTPFLFRGFHSSIINRQLP